MLSCLNLFHNAEVLLTVLKSGSSSSSQNSIAFSLTSAVWRLRSVVMRRKAGLKADSKVDLACRPATVAVSPLGLKKSQSR